MSFLHRIDQAVDLAGIRERRAAHEINSRVVQQHVSTDVKSAGDGRGSKNAIVSRREIPCQYAIRNRRRLWSADCQDSSGLR